MGKGLGSAHSETQNGRRIPTFMSLKPRSILTMRMARPFDRGVAQWPIGVHRQLFTQSCFLAAWYARLATGGRQLADLHGPFWELDVRQCARPGPSKHGCS